MTRPIAMVFGVLAAACLLQPAAFAKARPTPPKPPANPGYRYLTKGLVPGHRYRVEVKSNGHVKFTGNATEGFTFFANRQFTTGSKSLKLSGTTPKKVTFSQPISAKLDGWYIALLVSDTAHRPLTVKIVDLGRHG